jgi:hypothetical protein
MLAVDVTDLLEHGMHCCEEVDIELAPRTR